MSVVAVVSGKASPGTTTSAAALAWAWPSPVVLADCDPAGGDLTAGWVSGWVLSGWLRRDLGVLSFATATRHERSVSQETLRSHLQSVPEAPRVRLLAGLQDAAHASSVGESGWRRLADVLAELSDMDAIVDTGRVGPSTPWPVLWRADLVLVAVRPLPRHVIAARAALGVLRRQVDPGRLGLLECAASPAADRALTRALDVPVWVELPEDRRVAAVFSDGLEEPFGLARSRFARAAQSAAERLAARLPAAESGDVDLRPSEVDSHA